jgi:hypothetical protein
MAEELTQEQRQDILHRIYVDFRKIIIFFCIGWAVIWIGMGIWMPLVLVGLFFIPGPAIVMLFRGASFGSLFQADYEVITTHSDGSKSSDGGAQSLGANLIVAFILAILFLIIGTIIQVIRAIILAVKYALAYRKVYQKPEFIHGICFVIIIGFVVLIGAPIIGVTITEALR